MKKRLLKRTISIFLFLMIFIATFGCQWLTFEDEQRTLLDEKTYYIDPSTLLESLKRDDKNVFILWTATPQATPYWSPISVQWKQVDYYFIAQSFHKFATSESLASWGLQKISFNLDCKDVNIGLQAGGFTFFKAIHSRERNSLLIHFIFISPKENEIYFSEEEYYPQLRERTSLDLAQIKFSAEDALQIAENAGAAKIRKDIGNNCRILETIESGGKYEGWFITYSSNDPATLIFQININPLTGEYKIVK